MHRLLVIKAVVSLCLVAVYAVATTGNALAKDLVEFSQPRAKLLEGLKPPKRQRPVIAIIGANSGAETTDYLIPYGVLKRANIADVYALGTQAGPVKLMPALTIQPDSSSSQFDTKYPQGADYVIVPAMHNANDPVVVDWVAQQAQKGAIIVGICAGAKVLGNAGLLENRQATTHWYDLKSVQQNNPSMNYISNKRYVLDDKVATTTGVTASLPISLTLVEAIAGSLHAQKVAAELGVDRWNDEHDSTAFKSSGRFYATGAINYLSFWNHETLHLPIENGVDEIALALTADAWSRTYRSKVRTYNLQDEKVISHSGISIIPDRLSDLKGTDKTLPSVDSNLPARTLDNELRNINLRYGQRTADFVALQLEYEVKRPD